MAQVNTILTNLQKAAHSLVNTIVAYIYLRQAPLAQWRRRVAQRRTFADKSRFGRNKCKTLKMHAPDGSSLRIELSYYVLKSYSRFSAAV
jgi:hypothetical protein